MAAAGALGSLATHRATSHSVYESRVVRERNDAKVKKSERSQIASKKIFGGVHRSFALECFVEGSRFAAGELRSHCEDGRNRPAQGQPPRPLRRAPIAWPRPRQLWPSLHRQSAVQPRHRNRRANVVARSGRRASLGFQRGLSARNSWVCSTMRSVTSTCPVFSGRPAIKATPRTRRPAKRTRATASFGPACPSVG
jgi:hypothetical protein